MGEIGAQVIDLATTVDTIRGTHQAKEYSRLDNLSDTAYDELYQALSETKENVTERDVQNYLFQQRLQDYTNQSDFGTGGKYTRAIQAITAFTQGIMGNNIVTAIANGSAPYLANEVKNQIQGSSVENDIQRTLAHGLVNAGLALTKGENVTAQADGAAKRRRESLKNIDPAKGSDRDEYPPAMFKEGGTGASVRLISPSDNRGAGSCIGHQCRELPDGTVVIIKLDESSGKQEKDRGK